MRNFWPVLLLSLAAPVFAASELQLSFSAIQKILAAQVLTEDGRLYLRATPKERCNFAYLKDPQVGEDHGRLIVKAQFTGRSARNFLGVCIGPGDSFPLSFTAEPYYQNGSIRMRDVQVHVDAADGYYRSRVRTAFTASLTKEFHYDLQEEAKRLLEQPPPKAPYSQALTGFQILGVKVTPGAIVLSLDFTLAIR